jgi:hypothetical protein
LWELCGKNKKGEPVFDSAKILLVQPGNTFKKPVIKLIEARDYTIVILIILQVAGSASMQSDDEINVDVQVVSPVNKKCPSVT